MRWPFGRRTPSVHNNQATLPARQGKLREAEDHLERARSFQPDPTEARDSLRRLRKALESSPH